ncbi:hypothetical protein Pelo_319 [Pelomyxa schiedti]|nr:hypothetical protein Pelo_319 [Pelomyxa schiedti]
MSSRTEKTKTGGSGERYWQVFFVPKDCVSNPTSYVAYCPYTHILGEGDTVREAATRWRKAAKRVLQSNCDIPKYMLIPTKLLYGEKDGVPFYAISCLKNSKRTYDIFSPKVNALDIPSTSLPSVWIDWNVQCTPRTVINEPADLTSITPNCIN